MLEGDGIHAPVTDAVTGKLSKAVSEKVLHVGR
jgi:hypothetical protein